jgi:phage anti-repressor protein
MNFKDFILKYSSINSKFLEDFYKIIREDYIEKYYEFLIDSEILRKWLQINSRRAFNDTIKRSYKKNIDYTIEKIKKSIGSGGQNFEVITLTPEAAKKICLSTNSKIGRQVQQYFLDLEVVLYKYKNYIIAGMNEKIKQLENNQKSKINPTKGIIYIFKALNTNLTLHKLGKTINSKIRFKAHNSPMANDINVLFQYETDNIDQVESCVKALMKKSQYRKYKEVYQVDLDILRKTILDCDKKIKEINDKIEKNKKKTKSYLQTGGNALITDNDVIYMLIPKMIKTYTLV